MSQPVNLTVLNDECRPMLARGVRLRSDPITGEPVLLFPEGFLLLDEASHDILIRCSGGATLQSIVLSLAGEYEIPPEAVRPDIFDYLEQLRRRMLIALAL